MSYKRHGASPSGDRATHERSPAVSALRVGIASAVRVTALERPILLALRKLGNGADEGWHWSFRSIADESGVEQVRAPIRRLARKGLAKFSRGLWTDDGTPAGSGYAITSLGLEVAEQIGGPND